VKNQEVLQGVREERNILHKIKHRKGNWTGHIFHRNCLLKLIIEGMIDVRWDDWKEDVSMYWMILRKQEDTGN